MKSGNVNEKSTKEARCLAVAAEFTAINFSVLDVSFGKVEDRLKSRLWFKRNHHNIQSTPERFYSESTIAFSEEKELLKWILYILLR